MQIGVKRVTLIVLAVIVWLFNIAVWLSAISAGVAWLLSTWKPELASAFPVTSQLKLWVDASLFDFAPVFELLVLTATAFTTPFAIWLWRKATTISVEDATSTRQDVTKAKTRAATAAHSGNLDDKLEATATAKSSAEQLSYYRELLVAASRRDYIVRVESLVAFESSLSSTLSLISGYARSGWNTRTNSARRPYLVEVKKPNEASALLSETSSMTDVVGNTKGWRIIALATKAYSRSDEVLAVDMYKELLDKVQPDFSAPVPVWISLSEWFVDDERSFEQWVMYRLNYNYKVPKEIGAYWLSSGSLVLVLSGYPDDYDNMHRRCHDALEEFWKFSLVSIVIEGGIVSKFQETGGLGLNFFSFPADATMKIPEPTSLSADSKQDQ